jgi:hypothetical protein
VPLALASPAGFSSPRFLLYHSEVLVGVQQETFVCCCVRVSVPFAMLTWVLCVKVFSLPTSKHIATLPTAGVTYTHECGDWVLLVTRNSTDAYSRTDWRLVKSWPYYNPRLDCLGGSYAVTLCGSDSVDVHNLETGVTIQATHTRLRECNGIFYSSTQGMSWMWGVLVSCGLFSRVGLFILGVFLDQRAILSLDPATGEVSEFSETQGEPPTTSCFVCTHLIHGLQGGSSGFIPTSTWHPIANTSLFSLA